MAEWYAQQSNVSIQTVGLWTENADGSGAVRVWPPTNADTLHANGKTSINIDTDFTAALLTSDNGAGGFFCGPSSGTRTITASIGATTMQIQGAAIHIIGDVLAGSGSKCLYTQYDVGLYELTIDGDLVGGSSNSANYGLYLITPIQRLTVTGSITGGTAAPAIYVDGNSSDTGVIGDLWAEGGIYNGATQYGIVFNGSGLTGHAVRIWGLCAGIQVVKNTSIEVTGDVRSSGGLYGITHLGNTSTGTGATIVVTGNVGTADSTVGKAAIYMGAGSLTVNGNVVGGSAAGSKGILFFSQSLIAPTDLTINGNITGGSYIPTGVNDTTNAALGVQIATDSGTCIINGDITAGNSSAVSYANSLGVFTISVTLTVNDSQITSTAEGYAIFGYNSVYIATLNRCNVVNAGGSAALGGGVINNPGPNNYVQYGDVKYFFGNRYAGDAMLTGGF